MEFKHLFDDEDAVSPVIGVILMVAITVILAAVIGTFVLGLGDQVSNTSPTASFTFDYDDGDDADAGTGTLTITHDGGDKIEESALDIATSGTDDSTAVSYTVSSWSSGDEVSAGDSLDVSGVDEDLTVRVTWESSNGGDTATLGKWTGPNAN